MKANKFCKVYNTSKTNTLNAFEEAETKSIQRSFEPFWRNKGIYEKINYLVLLKEVRKTLRSHRGKKSFDFSHQTEVLLLKAPYKGKFESLIDIDSNRIDKSPKSRR